MDIATKSTGDTMQAVEQNQVTNEVENAAMSTGQTPSSGDLFQLAKSTADYAAHGDFYTDSGSASTYVLTVISPKQATTAYSNGFRARFVVGNTNTGASTVNVSTLGVKSIKRRDGSALSEGDMVTGDNVILEYDGTDFLLLKEILQTPSIRDISRNLVIKNTVANPTFQMDIDVDAQRHLYPYPLYNSNTYQKKLLKLVDNPPKPKLWVWFDWREGCYKGLPAWEDMQKAVERERQEHKQKYRRG